MTTESREQDHGSARASRKSRGSPAIIEAGGSGGLDTSGDIFIPDVRFPSASTRIRWSDLDAFTQGYIEALMCGVQVRNTAGPRLPVGAPVPAFLRNRFSDLAAETLARIIADCAFFTLNLVNTAEAGRGVWRIRQSGGFPKYHPPLTVTLGDDGKVRLSSQRNADAGGEAVHSSPATDEQP